MRDLYRPDAYFDRLDALYLREKLPPALARTRYLRRHPWRWLKSCSWSVAEVLFIYTRLMRGVPDESLRRDYRLRLWTVVKRRPRLHLLRVYAIKCALHFHFDRLITRMLAERAQLMDKADDEPAALVPAKTPAIAAR